MTTGPNPRDRIQIPHVYSPIAVAVALSLYQFNVSVYERAQRLFEYFDGNCAELDELMATLSRYPGNEATQLAHPTARIYVQQALDAYGMEAEQRCFQAQLGLLRQSMSKPDSGTKS